MSLTRLFCTAAVIAACVYDVIALQLGGVDVSISRWFASFASYPMPVFAVGYLCGHFFGWMSPSLPMATRARLERLRADMSSSLSTAADRAGWIDRLSKILGDRQAIAKGK